jgi:hypothetical protein|tara:strand:+ start:485 stop:607 length:123 start_codon:yes stop_codon:yes gene_type:complete
MGGVKNAVATLVIVQIVIVTKIILTFLLELIALRELNFYL